MARPVAAAVLAVLAVLGAGCHGSPGDGNSAGTSSSATPPPQPPAGDCDAAVDDLPLPPTWAAHGGEWSGFAQADVARPQGQRGVGPADPDPGLGLLVDHANGPFSSIDVRVQVLLVRGEHPDGAGLVFHWDGGTYNIVRYSPSEGGWHVFTVVDGERTKIDATAAPGAPHGPGWCEWVELRVVAAGADVDVFQGGEPVLAATLPPGASTAGQAGPFVRGNTIALFAGYAVSGS